MNSTIKIFVHEETQTRTYLILGDKNFIIDPVFEEVLVYIEWLGDAKIHYSFDTHIHADHKTGAALLKKYFPEMTVFYPKKIDSFDVEVLREGSVFLGNYNNYVRFYNVSGHTDSSFAILHEDRLFTGDSLLIDGCGRTDFQGGDAELLFRNVREKLFRLPDTTLVYPGHSYGNKFVSNILQEKLSNQRLGLNKTLDEFKEIMHNLQLREPRNLQKNVRYNSNPTA